MTSQSVSTTVYRYRGRFTFHAPAEAVREVVTPTSARVEPLDDRSCTVRTGSNSLEELAVWVALLGFDFDIHEPEELFGVLEPLTARLERALGDHRHPQ